MRSLRYENMMDEKDKKLKKIKINVRYQKMSKSIISHL